MFFESKWRAIVFLALLLSSGVGGYLTYHRSEAPDDVNVGDIRSPLDLSFFVEDPTVQISASIIVSANGSTPWASLYLNESSPETVIILSSAPDIGGLADGKMQFEELPPETGGYADQRYVKVLPPFNVAPSAQAKGHFVTNFLLEPDCIREEGGLYAARLPTIANLETGDQSHPIIGVKGPVVRAAALTFAAIRLTHGDFIEAISREPLSAVYWEPSTLTSSIRLEDYEIGNRVRTGSLRVNVPSTGTLQGDGFTWTGGLGLAPALSLEDSAAQQKRSTYAFLAGVLLATGAACLVALVQEGPERFSLLGPLKRDRKTASASMSAVNVPPVNIATGGKVDPPLALSNVSSRQSAVGRINLAIGMGIATVVLIFRWHALTSKMRRRQQRPPNR